MKTTVDLPDTTFRQAKTVAAARGMTLKRFLTEALEERLRRCAVETGNGGVEPAWMAGFGALSDIAEENRHVLDLIEEEFERLSPRRSPVILDTNALSAWAEGIVGVEAPLRSADRLVVPSVVLGEYYFGIRQSRHRRRYEEWLARYLPQTEIATITSATANTYADIRLELKHLGTPIPPNDVWVAALARQHDLAILTNDSHFDLVDQIKRIAF